MRLPQNLKDNLKDNLSFTIKLSTNLHWHINYIMLYAFKITDYETIKKIVFSNAFDDIVYLP